MKPDKPVVLEPQYRHKPIKQECCAPWAKAHEDGTDNEGWSALVYYDKEDERSAWVGHDLPRVKQCPWCGAQKD